MAIHNARYYTAECKRAKKKKNQHFFIKLTIAITPQKHHTLYIHIYNVCMQLYKIQPRHADVHVTQDGVHSDSKQATRRRQKNHTASLHYARDKTKNKILTSTEWIITFDGVWQCAASAIASETWLCRLLRNVHTYTYCIGAKLPEWQPRLVTVIWQVECASCRRQ